MINILDVIKFIIFKFSNVIYRLPSTCKVWPSHKVKNIICEGYNTIDKNAFVYNTYLGYASGISKDSFFANVYIGKYSVLAPGIKN